VRTEILQKIQSQVSAEFLRDWADSGDDDTEAKAEAELSVPVVVPEDDADCCLRSSIDPLKHPKKDIRLAIYT
jgi:hypothetical protein